MKKYIFRVGFFFAQKVHLFQPSDYLRGFLTLTEMLLDLFGKIVNSNRGKYSYSNFYLKNERTITIFL